MIIKQNSRIQIHRITTAGNTFSVPPSEDFTDGNWSVNDLMLGEMGINLTDERVFIRTTSGILEFSIVGGLSALWERSGHNIVAKDDSSSPPIHPHVLPSADDACDLGTDELSPPQRWRNLLLSGYALMGNITEVEKLALNATNGMIIYNTSINKFQGYENGAWTNLI
jgi:hypothetical protein